MHQIFLPLVLPPVLVCNTPSEAARSKNHSGSNGSQNCSARHQNITQLCEMSWPRLRHIFLFHGTIMEGWMKSRK
jgi:hypothetical protein